MSTARAQPAPTAFICHASEDKDRFVVPLAKALRNAGIDAWLDKWEIRPGDSVVRRIFNEGLQLADCALVVVSKHSATKPWILEEIDAAFVHRIERQMRIIPIILDGAPVPPALKATRWISVKDLSDIQPQVDELVATLHGATERPALGHAPPFVKTPVAIAGLTAIDAHVLQIIGRLAFDQGYRQGISTESILSEATKLGLAKEQLGDSLQVLDEDGLIEGARSIGEPLFVYVDLSLRGMDTFVKATQPSYEDTFKAVCRALVNEGVSRLTDMATKVSAPIPLVEHVFDVLASKGLADVGKYLGPHNVEVHQISPKLKRQVSEWG